MFSQLPNRASLLISGSLFLTVLFLYLLISGLQASAAAPSDSTGPEDVLLYLPAINRGLTTPILQPIQLVCGSDSWTVNWGNNDTAVTYELQEDHDPNFVAPTIYTPMTTSQTINNAPSPNNLYHYRVRSTTGSMTSPWSNTVSVVGNFYDDFTDINSGWAITETAISMVGYDSGEYFVNTKDAGNNNLSFLASSLSPDINRTNYIIEADVHWQSGSSTSGLYGLVFGANADVSKYYFVGIFTNLQEYQVFYFDSTLPVNDRLQSISPRDDHPAIQQGTAVNHIRVERIGENITLQINGADMGSWSDNRLTGLTRAGVVAVANQNINPVVKARYDNFKISGCDNPTAVVHTSFNTTAVTPLTHTISPEALFDSHK
jgi:hypothetical protein